MRNRILVTGANGFVGRALVVAAVSAGYDVTATSRNISAEQDDQAHVSWRAADLTVGPLDHLLGDVWAVVHAAGIAHAAAAEAQHRAVTVEGTRRLVAAMRRAGTPRLVFLSSIRAQVGACANGVVSDDRARMPDDAYGRAKRDAEDIVAASGLAATILRPVLVVGHGARGNLGALLRLARTGIPLPLASLSAKRSLVSRTALVSAILFALARDDSAGRSLDVADGEPLSLAQMMAILRRALGRRPLLFPVPTPVLGAALSLLGRSDDFRRVARPLIVAADGLAELGWRAPETARAALSRMAVDGSAPAG